jgi:pimeloyl-ACP methyl ester carboxylesterase
MNRVGDLTLPHIAALYAGVPADQLERFQAFRRDFPYIDVTLNGGTWSYLSGGGAGFPLLILSGALAIPDISWTSIANFAAHWRVIVPAYPPMTGMDALVDGIAAILQREGLDQVHVMGGSYGGFVAQVFVRRHPSMSRSLVLSHTLPPYPEMAPRLRRSARWLGWLPQGMVRKLLRRTFQSMMPEPSPDNACLLAIFNELVDYTLTKKDVIGILARVADFSLRPFTPQDLSAWSGRVLLVFGENDPATPPDVRQKLEALYPGSQVHLFAGSGHTTSVTHQAEYQAVIEGFLSPGG